MILEGQLELYNDKNRRDTKTQGIKSTTRFLKSEQ